MAQQVALPAEQPGSVDRGLRRATTVGGVGWLFGILALVQIAVASVLAIFNQLDPRDVVADYFWLRRSARWHFPQLESRSSRANPAMLSAGSFAWRVPARV